MKRINKIMKNNNWYLEKEKTEEEDTNEQVTKPKKTIPIRLCNQEEKQQ